MFNDFGWDVKLGYVLKFLLIKVLTSDFGEIFPQPMEILNSIIINYAKKSTFLNKYVN